MRIGMVSHGYPRHDGDMAGLFVELLATALVERGHAVHVVTPADAGAGGTISRHGVTIHRIRYAPARFERLAHRGTMVEMARSPVGAVALLNLVRTMVRAVRSVAATESLDVVHAHWWAPSGVATAMACRRLGLPYVVTSHGSDVWLLGRIPGAARVAQAVFHGARECTAVSAFLAKQIEGKVRGASVVVQPMPIDSSGFSSESVGGAGVVTVGRLSAQKRVRILISAMAILVQRGRSIPLTIVGDGVERDRLERQARDASVDARFCGQVPPTSLPSILANMDVAVMPAEREGFGLAAVEALIAGVPVVVTERGGGLTEIVRGGKHGRMVKDHPKAIADAVEDLLDNEQARRAAAAAGRLWRDRLAPAVVARVFEDLYRPGGQIA